MKLNLKQHGTKFDYLQTELQTLLRVIFPENSASRYFLQIIKKAADKAPGVVWKGIADGLECRVKLKRGQLQQSTSSNQRRGSWNKHQHLNGFMAKCWMTVRISNEGTATALAAAKMGLWMSRQLSYTSCLVAQRTNQFSSQYELSQ